MEKLELKAPQKLTSEVAFQGGLLTLEVGQHRLSDGQEVTREVVLHPDAVCALVVDQEGRIPLVAQFRHGPERFLWELPAGKIDPGEDPELAVLREVREETGVRAQKAELLFTFFTTPAFCTERMYLYQVGPELTIGENELDGDEELEVRWFTKPELRELITKADQSDAKTLLGILYFLGC